MEVIVHTRAKVKHPQTNGICERFHRTIQDEFYSIVFRKRVFNSIEEIQIELDERIEWYNKERTHSSKYCFGKTPWETFMNSKQLAYEKQIKNVPWRAAEAFSIDNPLLGNQQEGLAMEDDSRVEKNMTQQNRQFSQT